MTDIGNAPYGGLIERAWDAGQKWLATFYEDHHPQAIETANQNARDFLNELADRVTKLEEDSGDTPGGRERINGALSDPDFSALLKDAMIASARTSSAETHRLLARVVSERLIAGQESLVSLAGSMAITAIPCLSSKHLRWLGVLNLVTAIRPHLPSTHQIPAEVLQKGWPGWFDAMLSPLLPVGDMNVHDYQHLEAVSCIVYLPFWSRDLKKVLSPQADAGFTWNPGEFLQNSMVGQQLLEVWNSGMQHARATSVGSLVGTYVKDLLTGTRTTFRWG